MSLVFWATALTSLAPMFSNGSASSISLLTVTPSLVTVGPPKLLSMMTFRPVGPRVLPTALASFSAPSSSFLRASSVYNSCFAILCVSPFGCPLSLVHCPLQTQNRRVCKGQRTRDNGLFDDLRQH